MHAYVAGHAEAPPAPRPVSPYAAAGIRVHAGVGPALWRAPLWQEGALSQRACSIRTQAIRWGELQVALRQTRPLRRAAAWVAPRRPTPCGAQDQQAGAIPGKTPPRAQEAPAAQASLATQTTGATQSTGAAQTTGAARRQGNPGCSACSPRCGSGLGDAVGAESAQTARDGATAAASGARARASARDVGKNTGRGQALRGVLRVTHAVTLPMSRC